MNDPRQKEKNEDDPVVQVVDSLNNAMDDLELANNELDQNIQEIDKSVTTGKKATSDPQDQKIQTPQVVTPTSNQDPNDQKGSTTNDDGNKSDDQNNSDPQQSLPATPEPINKETHVYQSPGDADKK